MDPVVRRLGEALARERSVDGVRIALETKIYRLIAQDELRRALEGVRSLFAELQSVAMGAG